MRTFKLVGFAGLRHSGKSLAAGTLSGDHGFKRTLVLSIAHPVHAFEKALGVGKKRDFRTEVGDLVLKHHGPRAFLDAYVVNLYQGLVANPDVDLAICDDLRPRPEIEAFRNWGGVTVYLDCPDAVRRDRGLSLGTWVERPHGRTEPTDTRDLCDAVIRNDGDMDAFRRQVLDVTSRLLRAVPPVDLSRFAP